MAQTEFNNCPKCGIGKMKPTGGAEVSSNDPQTGKETGFYREYKCDNCGHPEGSQAKVLQVNEQVDLSESANIKSGASGNSYDPTAS
jgi:predicted RNA-binding Zn-ribbon protein involved in translation (DUF1610 family)